MKVVKMGAPEVKWLLRSHQSELSVSRVNLYVGKIWEKENHYLKLGSHFLNTRSTGIFAMFLKVFCNLWVTKYFKILIMVFLFILYSLNLFYFNGGVGFKILPASGILQVTKFFNAHCIYDWLEECDALLVYIICMFVFN